MDLIWPYRFKTLTWSRYFLICSLTVLMSVLLCCSSTPSIINHFTLESFWVNWSRASTYKFWFYSLQCISFLIIRAFTFPFIFPLSLKCLNNCFCFLIYHKNILLLKFSYPHYFFITSYPDFACPCNKMLQLQKIPISACCRTSTSREILFLLLLFLICLICGIFT